MTLPAGLSAPELGAVLAIFLMGGFVKGALGFGLPIATISVLPLVIPVDMALAINTVVQPLTNLGQLFGSGHGWASVRRFWPMTVPLAVGVGVGASFVKGLDPETLLLILGLFVMAFTALSLRGVALPVGPRRERAAGLGTGFVAGLVGALTAANGPIFVMYLLGLRLPRQEFRGALGFLFIVSGALIAGGFWSVGFLDAGRAVLALLCIPSAFLGMWAGDRAAGRLPAEAFRLAVLIALFGLGAAFVMRGAGLL